ncbi:MAG: TRAP transporter small permease [Marinobacter sp.]|uniref:TRAP transporter small permease n=1 Tax=Marinobacter sp. TaxID=50741 RepID=UPI0034A02E73
MYEKTLTLLTRTLTALSAVLFLIMTTLVCLQVFYRYVLNAPLTGSEEAARALLIYVVLLGAASGVGNRSHLTIGYFYERFPVILRKAATLLYFISILSIALLFVIQGWDLAQRTMMQTTPALRIPKGLIVYAFPIGGALMCIYSVSLIKEILGASNNPHSAQNKKSL